MFWPRYLTLGPKFYNFNVLSPRICFCFVNPYILADIAANHLHHCNPVSKHDLKPSGTFFVQNLYATLASQVTDFAPGGRLNGDLAWRNLAQYQHRSALHAPYFACVEIWYLPMFLTYQRASRPYKRIVFEVFSFCIFKHVLHFYILGVGGMRL